MKNFLTKEKLRNIYIKVITSEKYLWITFSTTIHILKSFFSAQTYSTFKVENHYLGLARNEVLSLVGTRSDRTEKPRHNKHYGGFSGLFRSDAVKILAQIINRTPVKGLILEQFFMLPDIHRGFVTSTN